MPCFERLLSCCLSGLCAQELKAQKAREVQPQGTPEAAAKPTDLSVSADGKVVKKAKVHLGSTVRGLFPDEDAEDDTIPGEPQPGLGDTGAGPDEMAQLRAENVRLQGEVESLREQIAKLTLEPAGTPATATELSDEAARKRLERICKANARTSHGFKLSLCALRLFPILLQIKSKEDPSSARNP